MRVAKQLVNSKQFLSVLFNTIYFNNNSFSNSIELSSKMLIRQSKDLLNLRFINNYGDFSNFISKSVTISKKSNKVGFVELDLIGLGFRVRKLTSNIYRFFFGKANFLYIFVNKNIIFKSYSNDSLKIRRVYIMGNNITFVNNLSAAILLLQPLNSYRVTGVVDPRKVIVLRSGKQR